MVCEADVATARRGVVVSEVEPVKLIEELKSISSLVESQSMTALGVVLPRSKAKDASSVSAVALSELIVQEEALVEPPVTVPAILVASTVSNHPVAKRVAEEPISVPAP